MTSATGIDWLSIGETAGGVIIGGIIALAVSWLFYRRSTKDLDRIAATLDNQADRAQHTLDVVARALEQAGLARLHRDAEGRITGIVLAASGTAGGSGGMTGTATVATGETPTSADQ